MKNKCLRKDTTENYNRCRQKNPNYFDKDSFRTKKISKNKKIIVGCKKGFYDKKRKVCKISTEIQSIITKKKK
jgi:hypothetical protein